MDQPHGREWEGAGVPSHPEPAHPGSRSPPVTSAHVAGSLFRCFAPHLPRSHLSRKELHHLGGSSVPEAQSTTHPQGLWLKCLHKFLAEPCLLLTSNLPFPIFVMNQVSTLRNTQSQMLQEDPGNILLPNLHADWSKCPGHSHSDSAIRGGQVKRSNLSLLHGNLSSHPDSLAPRTSADEKG